MGLNFLLFLTASWNTTPYFLGPDLVFTFAWLPFVLAGASGQPALDNVSLRPSEAMVRRTRLRPPDPREPEAASAASTRRVLLVEFAGVALAIAGISVLAKGSYSAARTLSAGGGHALQGRRSGRRRHAGGGGQRRDRRRRRAAKLPSGAVKLGPGSRLAERPGGDLQRTPPTARRTS